MATKFSIPKQQFYCGNTSSLIDIAGIGLPHQMSEKDILRLQQRDWPGLPQFVGMRAVPPP